MGSNGTAARFGDVVCGLAAIAFDAETRAEEMIDSARLMVFFLLVLGIVILPGLDMAYIIGNGLSNGRTAALTAVAGIVAASICHVTLATLGITLLITRIPGALNILLLAGSIYIAWIGFCILRSRAGFEASPSAKARSSWTTFRQGMTTNLLNPKAYLFTLAVFPQFLRPQDGAVWFQAVTLWIIIAATQIVVYGPIAMAAGTARHFLSARPHIGLYVSRSVGVFLMLAAAFAAYEGWHRL